MTGRYGTFSVLVVPLALLMHDVARACVVLHDFVPRSLSLLSQGDHNLWRKCYGYEITSHVPGIIAWPQTVKAATPRGSVTPLLAEMRDVFPTVLDIAGECSVLLLLSLLLLLLLLLLRLFL